MSRTILVIDEDPLVLKEAEYFLTKYGFFVHTAPDGFNGIKMINSNCYEMVISNCILPGKFDGNDIARHTRLVSKNRTKIIGISEANAYFNTLDFDIVTMVSFPSSKFWIFIKDLLQHEKAFGRLKKMHKV